MSCLLVEVELEGDLVVELVSEPPERDDVLVRPDRAVVAVVDMADVELA
jgi:hypothetical protein